MLQVMSTNEFEPAPAEHLLAAFRILDPEGKGYIKKDVL
jgi:Ca2+-binding EF-hand superfamily protein